MNRISGSVGGGAVAAAAVSTTPRTRSTRRTFQTVRHDGPEDNSSGASADFPSFAEALRLELDPSTLLEGVLAERAIVAAWRLHMLTATETAALGKNGVRRLHRDATSAQREIIRAERGLERALHLFYESRDRRGPRWGKAEPEVENPIDLESSAVSNEWPVLPDRARFPDDPDDDNEDCMRWQDRLIFDFNVSETSPVVKGTWVTVSHVVSLIVDGWTWADILRTHPELIEEDIRTCLAYTVAQDNGADY